MPWSQHWHQASPMGRGVRNNPPAPTRGRPLVLSRRQVGLGLADRGEGLPHDCVAHSCARRWQVLALIPLQYPTEARVWWYFCGQSTRSWSPGSCAAVSWMWRSASDVCRYLAARMNACCGYTGGTRASARTRRRPGHVGMRAAGVCVRSCDQRRAGDSSGAAEELRAWGQRLKDMNIYSHEYAVYAYDTG